MSSKRHLRGFTLIELLVVIVIVATILSIAVLSMGLVDEDEAMTTERTRLASLIETIQDEALLQGREFGVELMTSSYRFVEFDHLLSTFHTMGQPINRYIWNLRRHINNLKMLESIQAGG